MSAAVEDGHAAMSREEKLKLKKKKQLAKKKENKKRRVEEISVVSQVGMLVCLILFVFAHEGLEKRL